MVKQPVPLTALSEAQRAQALERFAILLPALEEGVSQAQIARTHHLPKSTVQRSLSCDLSRTVWTNGEFRRDQYVTLSS
jgi:Homeodomain-like domain